VPEGGGSLEVSIALAHASSFRGSTAVVGMADDPLL
jgi:hypothetical protein